MSLASNDEETEQPMIVGAAKSAPSPVRTSSRSKPATKEDLGYISPKPAPAHAKKASKVGAGSQNAEPHASISLPHSQEGEAREHENAMDDVFAVNRALVTMSVTPGEQDFVFQHANEAFLRNFAFVQDGDYKQDENGVHLTHNDSAEYLQGFRLCDLLYEQGIIEVDDPTKPLGYEKIASAPTNPRVMHHLTAGMVQGVPVHCFALMRRKWDDAPIFAHIHLRPLTPSRVEQVPKSDDADTDNNKKGKKRRRGADFVATKIVPKVLNEEEYKAYHNGVKAPLVPAPAPAPAPTLARSATTTTSSTDGNGSSDSYSSSTSTANRSSNQAEDGGSAATTQHSSVDVAKQPVDLTSHQSKEEEKKHNLIGGVTNAVRGDSGRFTARASEKKSLSSSTLTEVQETPGVSEQDVYLRVMKPTLVDRERIWASVAIRCTPIVGAANLTGFSYYHPLRYTPSGRRGFLEMFNKESKAAQRRLNTVPVEFLNSPKK